MSVITAQRRGIKWLNVEAENRKTSKQWPCNSKSIDKKKTAYKFRHTFLDDIQKEELKKLWYINSGASYPSTSGVSLFFKVPWEKYDSKELKLLTASA